MNWLNQQGGVQVVEGPADAGEGGSRAARSGRRDRARQISPIGFERRARLRCNSYPTAHVTTAAHGAARAAPAAAVRRRDQQPAPHHARREPGRGATPLAIEEIEVSTAQQRAAQILTFIPMFIMVAGFVGGMQIATDSTAGERERGSLEPLLVNPAPRVAFVAGKWMAATLAAIVSVCLTTVLCAQIDAAAEPRGHGHPPRDRSPARGSVILLAVGPMCLFTAALQAAVATLARSFKEAQTYMGVLILGPMLPGIMSALYPIGKAAWMRPSDARTVRSSDRRPWRTRPRLDRVSRPRQPRRLRGQRDSHSNHDRTVQERTPPRFILVTIAQPWCSAIEDRRKASSSQCNEGRFVANDSNCVSGCPRNACQLRTIPDRDTWQKSTTFQFFPAFPLTFLATDNSADRRRW